jgi:hypothetical protein
MTVVDLKPKRAKRAPRSLPLEQATDAARFFDRMTREIETDLGGRRQLSRIEGELVRAFCGGATVLRYLNRQVALGEISEVNLSDFATVASTMLRIGSRLGLARRPKDVAPSLPEYLAQLRAEDEVESKAEDEVESKAEDEAQP